MSPKLPVLSGEDLIRVLQKFGCLRVRQKGSHGRVRHPMDAHRVPITVPLHREIAFGTLKRVLRDSKISVEELISYLP